MKYRALLLDDWRELDDLHLSESTDHYEWTICRNNREALKAIQDNPRFDGWFLDYDLGLCQQCPLPMIDTVLADHSDKIPAHIRVISDHPEWKWYTDEIKTRIPSAYVCHDRKAYVSEGHMPEPIMTIVFKAPTPMPDLTGILNQPPPSPWFDANKKKGPGTVSFKQRTKHKGR